MQFQVDIDVDDLYHGFSQDELILFIKELDLRVASVDFTEKLAQYFVTEMKKEYEHDGEAKFDANSLIVS